MELGMSNPEIFMTTEAEDGTTIELGIKKDTAELTVNGKPVVVRERLDLTFWQKVGGIIAVVSAAFGGFYAFLQIIDWFRNG
jgi:hypothetical protein